MTTTQHTPGPLLVVRCPGDVDRGTEYRFEVQQPSDAYIGQADTEADARLWAAGPDMLEALYAAYSVLDTGRALGLVEQAIEKATGEYPR